MIEAFLAYAQRDRDRSVHTIARYTYVLGDLARTCDPPTATLEQVEAWWATRYDMAPATRANDLACLRTFYRWMMRFDHRPDDPTRRLDAPKIPNTVPRPIGEADLGRLLAATEGAPDVRRAVCLGAYAGLRVAEAAGLDWSMIDQEARRMYVRGKGRKERLVGLSPVLLDKLLPESGGNVVTAGARPYSADTLQRRVNRLMEREGIEHTFHSLRKRWATLAIAKTGNVHAVASAAGWSSIETASNYAVASDETLDAIAAAVI